MVLLPKYTVSVPDERKRLLMIIMHTANKAEYENEIKTEYYGVKSLERCGFIHCSDLDTYYMVAPIFKDDYTEKVI